MRRRTYAFPRPSPKNAQVHRFAQDDKRVGLLTAEGYFIAIFLIMAITSLRSLSFKLAE